MNEKNESVTRAIVDRYVDVWKESDPGARRDAIATIWAPDGAEFVEGTQFRGREELDARIAHAYQEFIGSGGYDVTTADDVTRHDDIVTFTIQLSTSSGEIAWGARVFLVLTPDGLVKEDYHLTVKPLAVL